MPQYEYKCNKCGRTEDRLVRLADRDGQVCRDETCGVEGSEKPRMERVEVSQTAKMGFNWADWQGPGR